MRPTQEGACRSLAGRAVYASPRVLTGRTVSEDYKLKHYTCNMPHTCMTLKNLAFLAFVGMILVLALVTFDLISDLGNVARGVVPAIRLFRDLIYTFAALCVTIFFFVFYRKQST